LAGAAWLAAKEDMIVDVALDILKQRGEAA